MTESMAPTPVVKPTQQPPQQKGAHGQDARGLEQK